MFFNNAANTLNRLDRARHASTRGEDVLAVDHIRVALIEAGLRDTVAYWLLTRYGANEDAVNAARESRDRYR